jgi:hypothetical protein
MIATIQYRDVCLSTANQKHKKKQIFELPLVLHVPSILTLREPHILSTLEKNLPRRVDIVKVGQRKLLD